MNKKNYSGFIDKAIVVLLTIQIAVVSISIAISSIAFGLWVGLWLIQTIVNGKPEYSKKLFSEIKLVNFFVLAYCFFEILSRFFAVYPEGAFANIKKLLLFLVFYVSVIKLTGFETISKMFLVNLIAVSLISVYELVLYGIKFNELIRQMNFTEIRIDYFVYPLTAGEIKMMVLLSILPMLFIKKQFMIGKKYLVLFIVPIFISMILTQSRNVFLSMFICFLIYGIFVNKKFLISFLGILLLMWILLPSKFTERFRSIVDLKHPSNESRINMWDTGLKIFYDHPFTGVADSHILEIYETYRKPLIKGEGVHLHNNFIMILATTGIFGFIAFIGIFISIFFKQIKFYRLENNLSRKMLMFGSILVMISFHISGIFEWTFGDHEVVTVFFFLISVPFVLFKETAVND